MQLAVNTSMRHCTETMQHCLQMVNINFNNSRLSSQQARNDLKRSQTILEISNNGKVHLLLARSDGNVDTKLWANSPYEKQAGRAPANSPNIFRNFPNSNSSSIQPQPDNSATVSQQTVHLMRREILGESFQKERGQSARQLDNMRHPKSTRTLSNSRVVSRPLSFALLSRPAENTASNTPNNGKLHHQPPLTFQLAPSQLDEACRPAADPTPSRQISLHLSSPLTLPRAHLLPPAEPPPYSTNPGPPTHAPERT